MHSLYLDLQVEPDLDHDQARQRGARGHAVAATASPLASLAAINVIKRGGSAADAVVAAQAVLGLVEPHASGFGGGTVIVWQDQQTGEAGVIDGLAAAPAAVTDRLQVDFDGRTIPRERAMFGGRTVGVPGTLRALEKVHQRFGRLPWHTLFDAAREHANVGFAMPPYLVKTITEIGSIQDEPLAQRIYCGGARRAVAEGTLIRNSEYAKTLAVIAEQGADVFYQGIIAENLIKVVTQDGFASRMTLTDLKNYAVVERQPTRYHFNGMQVMTAPAPVFGGISVGQIVGMIQALGLTGSDLTDNPELLHAVLEAGRLAFADRGAYIGDSSDASINSALLDPAYLAQRAKNIDFSRRANTARPGDLGVAHAAGPDGTGLTSAMTSHLVVSDLKGLTLSMTTTINQNFGSRLSTGGFYLNNVQTNFAAQPTAPHSEHRAYNAMAPGKRAMTSFAPSIMLDANGQIKAALGAGGGNRIVGFVANAMLRIAAGYDDAQKIVSAPQAMNWNGLSNIELGFAHARADLAEREHYVVMRRMDGGTQVALKQGDRWSAGGDIRRDGTAIALVLPNV
jgi:gamma-glutamyltranspeptidase/glutathione hydrolase